LLGLLTGLALALVLGCAASLEADTTRIAALPEFPGSRPIGVQIWNLTSRPIRCRIHVENDSGLKIDLAEDLRVEPPRRPIDPFLGGDPGSQRSSSWSLPPDAWTIVIENDAGQVARMRAVWPEAHWCIASVTQGQIVVTGDSGPRFLE
jgi:hypothetical protein